MKISMHSLTDWLESNTGNAILIRKQEQEDLDEVRLNLSGIGYRGEQEEAIDDYTSDSALLLQGKGTIVTAGNEVQLPSDTFEIPLAGLDRAELWKDSLILQTGRAKYTITLQ